MADSQDRVSLELIDAGDHKDRVVQVLSKVKGLHQSPEQIVSSTPCTIAANIPRNVAEKLQAFLEKTGAMVMIEGGEQMFTPDDLPPEQEETETAGPQEEGSPAEDSRDAWSFAPSADGTAGEHETPEEGPSDDFGGFSAAPAGPPEDEAEEYEDDAFEDDEFPEEEEHKPGKLQQMVSRLKEKKAEKKEKKGKEQPEKPKKNGAEEPAQKGKKTFGLPGFSKRQNAGENTTEHDESEEQPDRKPKASFFSKFKQSKEEAPDEEQTPDEPEEIQASPEQETVSASPASRLVPMGIGAVVGILIGGLIAGVWGWSLIQSQRSEYDQQLADQLQQQSRKTQAEMKQREKAFDVLQRQHNSLKQEQEQLEQLNEELTTQADLLTAEIENLQQELEDARKPKRIEPEAMSGIGALSPAQKAMVEEFEKLKTRHAQSLEKAYDAQNAAECSKQVLLDGKGTMTYAQVVKQFSAQHTDADVMESESLLTPYIAEFKIPFQQKIRTGEEKERCQEKPLKELPTPVHHEFGSYYGYWVIQYEYTNGAWQVKPTVIEKNRALYKQAFEVGSPDSAKFLLDTTIFPELTQQ